EILSATVDDYRVRAERTNLICLIRGCGLCNDQCPRQSSQLNGVHAQAATGSGYERRFSRLQFPNLSDRVEDRANCAGNNGCVLQFNALGNEGDIVVLNSHVLGVAADHTPITSKLALGAQSLTPGPTITAGTADMVALHGCNPIAPLEGAHVAPDVDDRARDFMTEDARHLHTKFQRAIARHDVVEANTTRIDFDDNVLRTRYWIGNALEAQNLSATGLTNDHSLHWRSPFLG